MTMSLGLSIVGAIYLISAFGMYKVANNQKAMVKENDERNKVIQSSAGLIAYGVQTLLLFSSLILLYFMDIIRDISMLIFLLVGLVSLGLFILSTMYYKKIM